MTHTPLPSHARLYAILDLGYVAPRDATGMTEALLSGGADVLQLRAKGFPANQIKTLAREILPLCRKASVPFIINDFPEIAAEVDADGVHIGQDDGMVARAREIVGAGKIVGKSTHSLRQAVDAAGEKPDYIGFGPLFATPTKPEYVAIGLGDLAEVHELVDCPIFCIGGIKPFNLGEVLSHGARRVVLVSALLQASNPMEATRRIKESLPGQSHDF
jgi:thiamine-phosphate pyrophosphorylase